MIGLGLDLCEIARIERMLQKGDAFLRRFFTEEERAYVAAKGNAGAASAAAMFAAKEAFLKAAGLGLGGGVALNEIGVARFASWQNSCRYGGPAAGHEAS